MAVKNMGGKRKKICPNFFTRDVTTIILSKLPCKAILRFKVVCKEWLDIVTTDEIFAKLHYKNNCVALVCSKAIIDGYNKKSKNKKGGFYKLDPYRFGGSWDGFNVVNSCKGFLLMMGLLNELGTYAVYNPLTNETVFLPEFSEYSYIDICNGGLGFSHVTKQLKVVVFIRRKIKEHYFYRHTHKILIYTLGESTTGTWRWVCLPKSQIFTHTLDNKPVELNGVLHWQVLEDRIVCFDLEKEEFGEMSYTPCIGESGKCLRSVGAYRGLLCLGITVFGMLSNQLEMWVMKEYGVNESWMRIVVVEEALGSKPIHGSKPIFEFKHPKLVDIVENGEIIFLSPDNWYKSYHLLSYDPIKECFEKLRFPKEYSSLAIDLYTPSFFSLKVQE